MYQDVEDFIFSLQLFYFHTRKKSLAESVSLNWYWRFIEPMPITCKILIHRNYWTHSLLPIH